MKTLFPKQKEAADFFLNNLRNNRNTLDTSSVGTGKTVVACHIAKELGVPVAVVCPKAVIPSWTRELAECGVDPIFVMNYEKLRTGRTKFLMKSGKKIMRWTLPSNALVLVDEIHAAKGAYTQNAQIVISLVQQNYRVHGMSATAAENPAEMRALGYMLGLHSLNKPESGLKSWYGWMMGNGCYQDDWGKWMMSKSPQKLAAVKASMVDRVSRLSVSDFPDSFKNNRVFVEPIVFSEQSKILKAFSDLNITPEIVQTYIENGSVENSEFAFVNLLRARQLAEAFKIKDIHEMAEQLIHEGNSVVVFVNFRETVESLSSLLQCPAIHGGQSTAERQKAIDDFQNDQETALVVNIAAGGTGISLHDVNGKRPRVSLICPTYNAKQHLQALGRIHRNGAKSDAVQKILVAADSIEEVVIKAITEKTTNLKNLWE